jgi:outer membrane protein insertion porin family
MDIFLNQGFVFAVYDSTIVYKDTSRNKADIDIYFTPGNQYVIDTVMVRTEGVGARYVDEKLLQGMTALEAGDLYNLEKIRRRQIRLYRTGLFSSVTVSAVEKDTSQNRIPILVYGNIGMMNELSPEIIMNNQQNAFNIGLGVSYIRKNFFGDARKLTISSSFGVQDIFNVGFGGLIEKFSFRDTTLLGFFDSRVVLEQPFRYRRPIDATLEKLCYD